MRKYTLEIVVFITGMGVMVFELVGSRVLAPYVGTTIMVWSVLIGTILAFLSAGYWWGGKIADRKIDYKTFSSIIFSAALLVVLTGFVKQPLINFLENHLRNFRLEAFIATFILFGPGSFFMAAVSPYAVRLRIGSLKDTGRVVGNLYSISTLGSIAGTFLTGLVLVPLMGNTKIIFSLAVTLLIASLLAYREKSLIPKVAAVLLVVLSFSFSEKIDYHFLPVHFIHSAYQDIAIVDSIDPFNNTNRPVKLEFTSPTTIQSAMFSDSDTDLAIPYTRFFKYLPQYFAPNLHDALVIGGAGYSYPKDFLRSYPNGYIDVAEIDPVMTQTAEKYFRLTQDPRLTIYEEDGRTYLNHNQKKYDAVFVDAFRTFVAPFQLTTKETAQRISDSLNDNGIVLVNMIQSINGDEGKFFRAEYNTYKQVFPQLYVFRVYFEDPAAVQNIILVGTKSSRRMDLTSKDEVIESYLKQVWTGTVADDVPVITDDFAPVADYMLTASRAIKYK
jgi:spermidine synthase